MEPRNKPVRSLLYSPTFDGGNTLYDTNMKARVKCQIEPVQLHITHTLTPTLKALKVSLLHSVQHLHL